MKPGTHALGLPFFVAFVPFVAASVLSLGALTGCSSDVDDDAATDDQAITDAAKVKFLSDFTTVVTGTPKAGKRLRVEYALDRLPQCRGEVGGGGPAWNITGFYSENGAPAKTFEVTKLSSDGHDRVAKSALLPISSGGDVAIWFQVTSSFGCSEYDSQYGQNYHFAVTGRAPEVAARLVFKESGEVEQQGELHAGDKIAVYYEQGRLPQCHRVERGAPVWTVSGFSQFEGGAVKAFETGRANGSDRETIDAILELPQRTGQIVFWFEVNSIDGCMHLDGNGGMNYAFDVKE
ncbi:hypothetical protein AKJ09_07381 [Labilithrix luteola]|uniref:Lipoprotein n=1 Tax=Labilithrix luteola TaxID=1391654 RepID=A0A0K1Q4S3_9BACT|nr:DUF6209 family protein [Labilithrix luteola]AKV00718.1 hypothetical protein AKJ09_07381 [Labilithrix luteola]